MSIIVDRNGVDGTSEKPANLCSRIYLMGQKLWKYGPRIVIGQVFHSRDGWIGLKRREERLPRAAFSYSIERENILRGFVLVDTLVEFWKW